MQQQFTTARPAALGVAALALAASMAAFSASAQSVIYTQSPVQGGDTTPVMAGGVPILWNQAAQSAVSAGAPTVRWDASGYPTATTWMMNSAPLASHTHAVSHPAPVIHSQPTQIINPIQPVAAAPQPAPQPKVIAAPVKVSAPLWDSDFYGSIKGAGVFAQEGLLSVTDDAPALHIAELQDASGWGGSIAIGARMKPIGKALLPAIRVELQGSGYTAKGDGSGFKAGTSFADDVALTGGGSGAATFTGVSDATEELIGGFANLYTEVGNGRFVPYVGGGIGYGLRRTTATFEGTVDVGGAPAELTQTAETADWMWQMMAGFHLRATRGFGFDLGYKFLQMPDHDGDAFLARRVTSAPGVNYTLNGENRDMHIVEGGVTFRY